MAQSIFEAIDRKIFESKIESLNLGPIESISSNKTIHDVVTHMRAKKIGSLAVSENDILTGIVTERDVVQKYRPDTDYFNKPVSEIMTRNPETFKLSNSLEECILLLNLKKYRHIPITDENRKIIHMVSISDLLKIFIKNFPQNISSHGNLVNPDPTMPIVAGEEIFEQKLSTSEGTLDGSIFYAPVKYAAKSKILRCDIGGSLEDVLAEIQAHRGTAVTIVEWDTRIKGIITERDFLFKIFGPDMELKRPVTEHMTENPHCLLMDNELFYAINNMSHFRYRNIIVKDRDSNPVYLLSQLDILCYLAYNLFQLQAANDAA